MSADNFYLVCQNPETGRWHALMGFASDDEMSPPHLRTLARWFTEKEHAMRWAHEQYTEYGVSSGPWPDFDQEWVDCPRCDGDGEILVDKVRADVAADLRP